MKIAHLLFTHSFAGTERHAIELANAQAEHHEVTMLLHRRAAQQRDTALAHRLDARVHVQLLSGWRPLLLWRARRALRALRPDVAHAHLSNACRALHGQRGLCLRVATLHIRYKPQQHADMDALIAIAPWQLAEVPAAQREATTQIDNWTGPYEPAADARARLRREWGVAEHDYLIGALGRSEHSKGLDVLIRAFEQVRPSGARLVIVGHGRDWQRLRALAGPDIVMPGFVARPQDCFAAFDAFVSAARSEPFGLVFLEAMAAGLPILATASQGGQHFAAQIGRPLVPVEDVAALQAALLRLAAQRAPRQAYAMAAFDRAARVAQVEQVYRRGIAELHRGAAAAGPP
ncbi:MAG TPA: glycosyltransferase [Rubrivivax sp.]|nr:glycosyltransferase [Rubrivivax sp.]HPO18239.1 glycosyltransferase [Rubrivivax sp.]